MLNPIRTKVIWYRGKRYIMDLKRGGNLNYLVTCRTLPIYEVSPDPDELFSYQFLLELVREALIKEEKGEKDDSQTKIS